MIDHLFTSAAKANHALRASAALVAGLHSWRRCRGRTVMEIEIKDSRIREGDVRQEKRDEI